MPAGRRPSWVVYLWEDRGVAGVMVGVAGVLVRLGGVLLGRVVAGLVMAAA